MAAEAGAGSGAAQSGSGTVVVTFPFFFCCAVWLCRGIPVPGLFGHNSYGLLAKFKGFGRLLCVRDN